MFHGNWVETGRKITDVRFCKLNYVSRITMPIVQSECELLTKVDSALFHKSTSTSMWRTGLMGFAILRGAFTQLRVPFTLFYEWSLLSKATFCRPTLQVRSIKPLAFRPRCIGHYFAVARTKFTIGTSWRLPWQRVVFAQKPRVDTSLPLVG